MQNKTNSTYLSFVINDERFAIPVEKVLEVLQKQKLTRVPNSPEHVKGVLNFRGEIIPVFETRTKFGLTDRSMDSKSVVIILEMVNSEKKIIVGAIVDLVTDVITIDTNKIQQVPQMSSSFDPEFLRGIVRINDEFVMILNVDKVFSTQDMKRLQESRSM